MAHGNGGSACTLKLARQAMRSARGALASASSLDEAVAAEAAAASAYWDAWAPVRVSFAKRDADRLPAHWLRVGPRHSALTHSPRLAASPANALLNYLY